MAIFLLTNGLTALFFLALVGIGLYWKNRPAAVVNFIGFLIIAASVYLEIQGLQNRVTLFAGMTSIGIILLANILLAITMIRRNSKADWQWQQNWNAYSKQVDYKMIFVENAFKEELDLHENEGMTEKLQALQMWKLGNEAYWNKSFTDALEKYDFSLKWEPTSVAWINKSGILNELERFNEAIHACDEAIKLNQERIEAWLNRGFAYDHLHQSDKAIKVLTKRFWWIKRTSKPVPTAEILTGNWESLKRPWRATIKHWPSKMIIFRPGTTRGLP